MKKALTGTAARAQAVQPYSRTIMAAVMTVLPADNQENALMALRIMECLHKVKRNRKPEPGTDDPGKLDDFVPPYLEFVQKVLTTCPPRRLFAGWLQPGAVGEKVSICRRQSRCSVIPLAPRIFDVTAYFSLLGNQRLPGSTH